MKSKNGCVHFKSEEPYFTHEKNGEKSNTVRLLSQSEYDIIQWTRITEIDISNPAGHQGFRRVLTDISRIGQICGSYLVVFSWK